MINCDPVTGTCTLPESDDKQKASSRETTQKAAIHYIGDPMCSWCWGISPAVTAIAQYCRTEGLEFTMTMGGLRAGGGDPWTTEFKGFLKNEWLHIQGVTGQPFSFKLLEKESFDYDTEPACRAVVAAKILADRKGLDGGAQLTFFSAVQKAFYVTGDDPKTLAFYKNACAETGIDLQEFEEAFVSADAQRAVSQNFVKCRQWGIRSFPTILIEAGGRRQALAVGYVSAEDLVLRAEAIVRATASSSNAN